MMIVRRSNEIRPLSASNPAPMAKPAGTFGDRWVLDDEIVKGGAGASDDRFPRR